MNPPFHKRKPWLAGLLSLLTPGLGQLYNGSVARAIAFFLIAQCLGVIAIVLMFARTAPRLTFLLGVLVALGAFLVAPLDAAVKAARAAPPELLKPYQRWYVYASLFAVVVLLQPLLAEPRRLFGRSYVVSSAAMEPALLEGDYVMAARSGDELAKNSIVVFNWADDVGDVVMRAVALPGDTVRMSNGRLVVNNQPETPMALPYTEPDGAHEMMVWQADHVIERGAADYAPTRDNWGPLIVPANNVFVLGDNRHASLDSRYRGFVPRENVRFELRKIYFSTHRREIRTARIGQLVR